MIFPWSPVVFVDMAGSVLSLGITLWCFILARKWLAQDREDSFRMYVFLLTASIVLFAASRSVGHLIKQYLLLADRVALWQEIAPYSGAINTTTFIIIFTISIYFQWHRKAYEQVQEYKNHLEDIVATLEIKSAKLEEAYNELKKAQIQLIQREKMASVGQLAAGVAHEINNPMGFIASNLGTLLKYFERLCAFVESMKGALREESKGEINEQSKKLKIDFISKDVLDLVNESLDGAARISKIVQGLKTFSRVDEAEYKFVDVNECMASTLGIVWNELKYKAEVKKEYGRIPPVECFPQQLSQVFMNLLINASQAIEKKGEIKIKTWQQGDNVLVSVADNGQGIAEEHMEKLFEPFFTTKEVGQGTGLGLSIAYEIIQKHHGRIEVASERGVGTRFTITLPITTSVENT